MVSSVVSNMFYLLQTILKMVKILDRKNLFDQISEGFRFGDFITFVVGCLPILLYYFSPQFAAFRNRVVQSANVNHRVLDQRKSEKQQSEVCINFFVEIYVGMLQLRKID